MDKFILDSGIIIKNARKNKGYSTQYLSKLLGISTGLINNIENGKTDVFNLHLLYSLSNILDIPITQIILYDSFPNNISSEAIPNDFNLILNKLIEFSSKVNWDKSKINTLCNKLIYEIDFIKKYL